MTQPLSPAAQAVLEAFGAHPIHSDCITSDLLHGALPAALRALADQVVPEEDWPDQSIGFADWNLATERCEQRKNTRIKILDIAAELENHQ
jgi:hypothetical protein